LFQPNTGFGPSNMISFLREMWAFLRVRKKFWLVPILMVLALFGA
jgi:hypothetical protein